MPPLKVLIVGASIAGPTAAYWLAKTGADITIIERYPSLRTGGQNVDIRTVGVAVMRRMPRMEAAVRQNLYHLEGMMLVDEKSRPFATIKPTGNPDQQSLISEYEILRGDLGQILFDMTKDNQNIRYVFNEQVSSMQQKGDGPVEVDFMNGLPSSQFDLVVACDGSTSRTRAMGFGCGVRDHIVPLHCWQAFYSMKRDLLAGSKTKQTWSTTGGRVMGIGPSALGASRITMMHVPPRNDRGDATLPFREAAKGGDETLKRYILQLYEGAGWRCKEIFQDLMQSDDFYATEMVQVKTPNLHKGRFVLVGDAGYSSGLTGTGTSLAMAGAYVLAGEIGRHPNDLAAGLRAYEERMKPIVDDLHKIPPGIPGIFAPQTAWGIWFRNNVFALVAGIMAYSSVFSGVFAWVAALYASAFGTDKHPLPDYKWVA